MFRVKKDTLMIQKYSAVSFQFQAKKKTPKFFHLRKTKTFLEFYYNKQSCTIKEKKKKNVFLPHIPIELAFFNMEKTKCGKIIRKFIF